MNTQNFSAETIHQAVEAIRNYQNDFDSIRENSSVTSVEEMAQIMIMQKFGEAQIEAEDIVKDIKKGIAEFDKQFAANAEANNTGIARQLVEATKDKSEAERKACYVNVLTALQLAGAETITKEEAQKVLDQNTNMSEDELLKAIETVADANLPIKAMSGKLMESIGADGMAQLAENIKLHKDDNRFMVALWLYVKQREENVTFGSDKLSAEQIGSLAAAGIETIITTGELEEGKISLDRWQTVMKWILGAAIGIALTLAVFAFSILVGLAVMSVIWDIIGIGYFASLLSLIVGVFIMSDMSKRGFEATEKLIDMFVTFYNSHIGTFTAKLKTFAAKVKEWAAEAVERVKSATTTLCNGTVLTKAQTSENSTNVEQPAGETETQQSLEPAMA